MKVTFLEKTEQVRNDRGEITEATRLYIEKSWKNDVPQAHCRLATEEDKTAHGSAWKEFEEAKGKEAAGKLQVKSVNTPGRAETLKLEVKDVVADKKREDGDASSPSESRVEIGEIVDPEEREVLDDGLKPVPVEETRPAIVEEKKVEKKKGAK